MSVTKFPNGISSFGQVIDGGAITTAGKKWYVSRNVAGTVDGKSWDTAFKTIAEAIAQVNSDYATAATPSKGRGAVIYIGEGWYAEVPVVLTASDVTIMVVAPGNHDSTVLYGVPVAGTFSGVAGGPALRIAGDNNTIYGLGVFTSDPLYAGIQNGTTGAGGTVYGNKFINCSFVRDVADGEEGGILDYGADGTLIEGCFFSTSCKDYGVRSKTNGVINPVNLAVKNCTFIGTPIGVDMLQGHNALIAHNGFWDDTSDRPDVVDTPIVIGGTAMCFSNYGMTTIANLITGSGTINDINNFGSNSATT